MFGCAFFGQAILVIFKKETNVSTSIFNHERYNLCAIRPKTFSADVQTCSSFFFTSFKTYRKHVELALAAHRDARPTAENRNPSCLLLFSKLVRCQAVRGSFAHSDRRNNVFSPPLCYDRSALRCMNYWRASCRSQK